MVGKPRTKGKLCPCEGLSLQSLRPYYRLKDLGLFPTVTNILSWFSCYSAVIVVILPNADIITLSMSNFIIILSLSRCFYRVPLSLSYFDHRIVVFVPTPTLSHCLIITVAKQKKIQTFVCTQLLNELSYKILVATKPDQPGHSSSTRLEVMMERTQHKQILSYR